MVIPTNRTSYSTLLFVAEKANLKNFSIVILSEDIRTSSTPDPLWFAALSMYTLQDKGSYKETMTTDFLSMSCFSIFSSIEGFSKLGHQICESLAFDRGAGHILDIKIP